jgi:hypothetical protein
MVVATPGAAFPNAPAYLPVLLDGAVVGFCALERIPRLVQRLRFCKVDPTSAVPDHLEVGVLPPANRSAYPGVFLFTTVVRALSSTLDPFHLEVAPRTRASSSSPLWCVLSPPPSSEAKQRWNKLRIRRIVRGSLTPPFRDAHRCPSL